MTRLVRLAPLAVLFALAGCGGTKEEPAAFEDSQWDQLMTAGRDSFELGRYTVAQTQYRKAANLALLHDSSADLAEAGYDLAVSQLAGNLPQQALDTAQATRKAVQLRGSTSLPYLTLVEAAALYRLGQYDKAQTLAAGLLNGPDTEMTARAALVVGIAADQRGDRAGLQTATAVLDGLKKPLSPLHQADWDELHARLIRKADPAQAAPLAAQAARLRQRTGAYHDMVRALVLEAEIAQSLGQSEKARALWAQAAQSAAAQSGKLNIMDAATLAHGDIVKGDAVPPADDAAVWAAKAGSITLFPFAEPKESVP